MVIPNKSLREKSAARMIAVQLAYSYVSQHKKPNAQGMLADVVHYSNEDDGGEFSVVFKEKPHMPTLTRLLQGYADHKEILEPIAHETLSEEWRPERVNPLLIIILEFGVLELDHQRELAAPVIVDEYTNIAARLLDQRDVHFVHASLKHLAATLRG